MNPRLINSIVSSKEETFDLKVFGYYHLKDLEKFYEKNNIEPRRVVYDGKPGFISEALSKEIVPNDGSHIISKLEPPKQNASYMVDLEDPKPVYKDFEADKFCLSTARASIETLVTNMNNPTFLLIYLTQRD